MTGSAGVALYRHLAGLYPTAFREEYRDDLVETFAAQLRDEGALRVWSRALCDLVVTVPAQRLEAHMKRSSTHSVAVVGLSIAVGMLALAAMSGTRPLTWIFLAVGLAALGVAAMSWKAARPAPLDAQPVREAWWKIAGSGAAVLAMVVGLVNIPIWAEGDFPGPMWGLMMVSIVAGVSLLAGGLALGVAHWFTRNRAFPDAA